VRPIWLASYPRSGNTFLRIVLQDLFRLHTYSVYRVAGQDLPDPSADALELAPFLPPDWRVRLTDSHQATPVLIKTHGPVEPFGDAIYLVREGRAAIDSYFQYHKKFAFEQPSLTAVIAGACQFGSWSEHFRSWQPCTRPRTLFLRYEELVSRPAQCVPMLAEFLGAQPVGSRLPTFAELKQRLPQFFRRGEDRGFLRDWTEGQAALFHILHSAVMEELGYPLEMRTDCPASTITELAGSAAHSHASYLDQLPKLESLGRMPEALRQELSQVRQELRQSRASCEELSRQLVQKEQLLQTLWVRFGRRVGLVRSRVPDGPPAGRVLEPQLVSGPNTQAS
jgi:hypothetical protein